LKNLEELEFLTFCDLCEDDYKVIALMLKAYGSDVKNAYILEDLDNGRYHKYYDSIVRALDDSYDRFITRRNNIKMIVLRNLSKPTLNGYDIDNKNLFGELL